ncbi:MAG: hypothetical protein U1F25_07245 [Rubrivivax sp.]
MHRPAAFAVAALAVAAGTVCPLPALANQGLVAASGEWLWPQLQARVTLQTASLTPLALARMADPTAAVARGVQGGALLGDFVFATPSFGNFRATSGVMLGNAAGAPVLSAAPSARLAVTVLDNGANYGTSDGLATLPYLGLGYSSPALWRGLSLNADLGLVAGRPSGLAGVGRAIFGNQPMDSAVRDLRLAPVLQLGVRYSF